MDNTTTPTVGAFCNCEYCTAARQEAAALEADRGEYDEYDPRDVADPYAGEPEDAAALDGDRY